MGNVINLLTLNMTFLDVLYIFSLPNVREKFHKETEIKWHNTSLILLVKEFCAYQISKYAISYIYLYISKFNNQ